MLRKFKTNFLPLLIAAAGFFVLSFFLYLFLLMLNLFPIKSKIQISLQPADIIIGMTIYLKTSIDFALFMGNLMHTNPGWQKRIAINFGTALGNCLGTITVLCIWFFLKEAPILLIIMIVLAALVLFEMAEEGLEEIQQLPKVFKLLITLLKTVNILFGPLLSKILPEKKMNAPKLSFARLFIFSLTIPFILGLDDFAGYIPLFTVVNVFSFILGVFLAHTLLNIGLFASPTLTTKITRHPLVVILGSIAFAGIGVWGLIEAFQILLQVNFL